MLIAYTASYITPGTSPPRTVRGCDRWSPSATQAVPDRDNAATRPWLTEPPLWLLIAPDVRVIKPSIQAIRRGGGVMVACERPPPTSARRRATSALRTHWRELASVLLLGLGAPISVAGGWASKHDRLWWLLAAGACAAGAGVLQLNRSPHPHLASPADAEVGSGSAAPGTLRLWNIPPPVRTYAGRDLQLAAIREQLAAGEAVALVPAAALHVVLVVLIAVLIMTTCCPSGSPLST